MAHDEDRSATRAGTDSEGAISRRQIITTAGLAAGAGLVTGRTSSAQQPEEAAGSMVGSAPQGATAAEFRARLAQTGDAGEHFVAYGYLTAAQGAADGALFAGPAQNETTALFTAYAVGELVRRTFDQSVHALDIAGTLTIYQRTSPGASFDDPDSFAAGTPVASFAVTLQDIVTVFLPGRGLPTLNGDMQQTLAEAIAGQPGRRFGRIGSRARLFATGIGTLVDPVRLNSLLEMAGHWTIR